MIGSLGIGIVQGLEVVVIEDLDRSEKEAVNRFIKELKRYYIPNKSKIWWLPWWGNRITFIINIKGEYHIASEKDENLYGKAFDYVLTLKDIHVDNEVFNGADLTALLGGIELKILILMMSTIPAHKYSVFFHPSIKCLLLFLSTMLCSF